MQLQLSVYLSIYISVCLFVFLFIYLSIYLPIYLSTYLSTYLSVYLSMCKLSKTKEFCETSSIFEVDNIKNETILRDFGKLSAELTASYQCASRFLHSSCLRYSACHEKVVPSHAKCCACHARSSCQNRRSYAPKCNPFQEINALTS